MNRPLLALFLLPVVSAISHAAERQPWVNTRLVGSPEPPAPYAAVRAFPNLETKRPVAIELEPGTGQLLLLQYPSDKFKLCRLRRFAPRAEVAEAETLIELPDSANSIGFHPRYPENGWIYVGSVGPGSGGCSGEEEGRPHRALYGRPAAAAPRRRGLGGDHHRVVEQWAQRHGDGLWQ